MLLAVTYHAEYFTPDYLNRPGLLALVAVNWPLDHLSAEIDTTRTFTAFDGAALRLFTLRLAEEGLATPR